MPSDGIVATRFTIRCGMVMQQRCLSGKGSSELKMAERLVTTGNMHEHLVLVGCVMVDQCRQLRNDCTENARRLRKERAAIAERMRGNCGENARRLHCECMAIAQRMRGDCTVNA
jgi:hypothetical protein